MKWDFLRPGQKEPWLKQELGETRSRAKVVKAKGRESQKSTWVEHYWMLENQDEEWQKNSKCGIYSSEVFILSLEALV